MNEILPPNLVPIHLGISGHNLERTLILETAFSLRISQ